MSPTRRLKSVFLGIPTRKFDLASDKSLWPLLVTITLNKIRNRGKKHSGAKRDLSRNTRTEDYDFLVDGKCSHGEAELHDLVSELLSKFSGRRRRIIELILEDYGVGEIARELAISERTVYNTRQRCSEPFGAARTRRDSLTSRALQERCFQATLSDVSGRCV